ncbi:MAG: LytTR family DNA-binding domain-containing protein [Eubacteriales bacterium]|nr:LytTR family DNA-binding domain-containing protein [Eubacteriales bacterium]
MLQIAVCDDRIQELNEVTEMIAAYARQHPESGFSVRPFQSGQDLLEHIRSRGGFQIYLLDVLMPAPDGLAIGAAIRKDDPDAVIVYLTISPDYAVESYGVQASGYLLKPVGRAALFAQLDRALDKLAGERPQMLTVQTKERVSLVRISDIRYVEGTNHTVSYYLSKDRTVTAAKRGPFEAAVAPLLADERFLRVGTSYLVNMLYVDSLEKGFLFLREGGKILIPRLRRGEVRERFLEFVLKRGLNS